MRLTYTLPVLWLVVSVVFLLIHIVPGDPVEQMLGEGARPADIVALRHIGEECCMATWADPSGSMTP
jgi:peptide/nickel transport system permease protein